MSQENVELDLDRELAGEGGNKVGTRASQEGEVAEVAEASNVAVQARVS